MSNITANITTIATQSAIQAGSTQAYQFFGGGGFATMIIIVAVVVGVLLVISKFK